MTTRTDKRDQRRLLVIPGACLILGVLVAAADAPQVVAIAVLISGALIGTRKSWQPPLRSDLQQPWLGRVALAMLALAFLLAQGSRMLVVETASDLVLAIAAVAAVVGGALLLRAVRES
jgi:uncharacterized membrane protein